MHVIQRYGGSCAICPISALDLIHAAHLVPDAERGTSDPRNGLPLCSNHHLALDRGLIAIEPSTRRILVARGYDAASLNVVRANLAHLRALPADAALHYRWDRRTGDEWTAVSHA
jgi:predicted restriction endonuclease